MIKKVIGMVVALAAIVVIVIAAMHSGRFSSLVFDEGGTAPVVEAGVRESPPQIPDSTVAAPQRDSTMLRDSLKLHEGRR